MTQTNLQAWRDQVAAAVRDVKIIIPGGTCWFRSALGGAALTHLGLKPRHVMGAALFRAGLDEKLDTVAFCGPGIWPISTTQVHSTRGWKPMAASSILRLATGGMTPLS